MLNSVCIVDFEVMKTIIAAVQISTCIVDGFGNEQNVLSAMQQMDLELMQNVAAVMQIAISIADGLRCDAECLGSSPFVLQQNLV